MCCIIPSQTSERTHKFMKLLAFFKEKTRSTTICQIRNRHTANTPSNQHYSSNLRGCSYTSAAPFFRIPFICRIVSSRASHVKLCPFIFNQRAYFSALLEMGILCVRSSSCFRQSVYAWLYSTRNTSTSFITPYYPTTQRVSLLGRRKGVRQKSRTNSADTGNFR